MSDVVGGLDAWRIEFTQEDLRAMASSVAEDLMKADVPTLSPTLRTPREATLGTPEIIITIVVTAAAKALIVSGLHALERALDRYIGGVGEQRAQIVLTDETKPLHRFPISLRTMGKDGLKSFMSQVEASVQRF